MRRCCIDRLGKNQHGTSRLARTSCNYAYGPMASKNGFCHEPLCLLVRNFVPAVEFVAYSLENWDEHLSWHARDSKARGKPRGQ